MHGDQVFAVDPWRQHSGASNPAKRPHAEVASANGAVGSGQEPYVTKHELTTGLQSLGDKLNASLKRS
eukprot:9767068-Karenia_brevis.AAC.1